MKKKKLKNKLRLTEARLFRLEQHMSELEQHTYDAVGDDIERLHEQVDMWAGTPLKDRVESLEGTALAFALDELRLANKQPAYSGVVEETVEVAMDVVDSAFEKLIQGLDDLEQQRIRDAQVTPTEDDPAWVLCKLHTGGFELSKYVTKQGLAEGETVLTLSSKAQLKSMMSYLDDVLQATGWLEGDYNE